MRTFAFEYRRGYVALVVSLGVIAVWIAYVQIWSTRREDTPLNTRDMTHAYQPGDELLGGATTIVDTARSAYGRSAMNFVKSHWRDFYSGKGVFLREWDDMPDGSRAPLGPLFSAVSCERCHEHDGRGRPPAGPRDVSESMIVRFSVPAPNGDWVPEPAYGEQLDMYGRDGMKGEGIVRVVYDEVTGDFADGGAYVLMQPEYSFEHLAYVPLRSDVRFSPRVAPYNFGLGLLEAVPDRDILANADPTDRDGDGISGRPNMVPDVRTGRTALGRFGWKANQPTIEQQIAKAFSADLGITSSLYPPDAGRAVALRPVGLTSAGHVAELNDDDLAKILTYVRLLAVPRQRNPGSPAVRHGRAIFEGIDCSGCHLPRLVTGEVAEFTELAHQVIHPYTDLLLHDMGEGLADDRPDGLAGGSEWRTPPLWGIGLMKTVSGHTRLLHDGRARSFEEAILWHGGEAATSQELYRRLSKSDRDALLAFLWSL